METIKTLIPLLLLVIICLEAIREDIKGGKISNTLCAVGVALGISASVATGGISKLVENSIGLVLGILLLIIPFSARMVGGGDVKLLGCIGSILGWKLLLPSFFVGAAIGGAIGAILIFLSERSLEKIRCRIVLARAGVFKMPQGYEKLSHLHPNSSKRGKNAIGSRYSNPERMHYSIPLSFGAFAVTFFQFAKHLN